MAGSTPTIVWPETWWGRLAAINQPAPAAIIEAAPDATALLVLTWPELWAARFAFYGWTPATDIPEPPPPEPGDYTVFQAIPWIEQWTGRLAFYGWSSVENPPTPAAVDEHTGSSWNPPARPWSAYKPQPQYGWNQANDVSPEAQTPERTEWAPPTRPWVEWKRQPSYGWHQANDQPPPDVPPGLGDERWTPPVRQWTEWRRQPGYGWTTAQDFSSVVIGAPDATSTLLVAWWSYWMPRAAAQLYYGNAWAQDQSQVAASEDMGHPVQWFGYPRQPQLGWWQANDVTPPPPPAFAHEYKPTPVLQWREWRRQPQYGWAKPNDQTPIVPAANAKENWTPPVRQWKIDFRRQPQLGWARAFDETGPVPTPGGIYIPIPRRRRR